MRFKKNVKVNKNIIVARIDDECCALNGSLGSWPWSRKIHAQLLRSIDKFLSPNVVMFDILFIGPSKDKIADIAFAKTIKNSQKVYLPYSFVFAENNDLRKEEVRNIEKPYEEFLKGAKGTGFINFQEDSDGRIRRLPLLIKHNNEWFPHIIFRLFLDYLKMDIGDLIIVPGKKIKAKDGSFSIPVDRNLQTLLVWPGKWKEIFTNLNCLEIMKMNTGENRAKITSSDNLILIGDTTTGSVDVRSTSLEKRVPLVYANAVLLNQLLNQEFIRQSSIIFNLIVSLLISIVIVFTSLINQPLKGLLKNSLIILIYLSLSLVLIIFNIHIPLFNPLFAALFSILIAGLYTHIRFKNHVDLKLSFQQKLTLADAKLPQFRDNLKIGNYSEISELGRGGMAIVYKGKGKDGKFYAIKVINPDHLLRDPTFKIRFKREIYTMKKVNHPNVITIYDSGAYQGVYYYVMEYFSAGDLTENLSELTKIKDWVWLAKFFTNLLSGLKAIHDVDLVHRDIKPANIMMNRNFDIKIADFGLAKREDEEHLLTTVGQVMGTPSYLAPELLGPEGKASPASDIYAMGIVLYEIITGVRPFSEYATMPQLIRAKVTEEVPSVSKKRSEVPKVLAVIIDKMIRKNPAERFSNVDEILRYLKAYITKEKK